MFSDDIFSFSGFNNLIISKKIKKRNLQKIFLLLGEATVTGLLCKWVASLVEYDNNLFNP